MFSTLGFIAGLIYGGDVDRLGDREYRVRESAHKRLEAAGWLAAPCVWHGLQSDCLERADRCERLWRLMERWADKLAVETFYSRHMPPVAVLAGYPEIARRMCDVVDRNGWWTSPDSWDWVQRTPYRTGSLQGDFELVILTARGK